MGKGPEQILLQRRHTDGQQTYEKMFHVTNHQINVNQVKFGRMGRDKQAYAHKVFGMLEIFWAKVEICA